MNPHRPNFRYVWNQISFFGANAIGPFFFSRGAAWEVEEMLEIGSLSDTSLHPISVCLVSRFDDDAYSPPR